MENITIESQMDGIDWVNGFLIEIYKKCESRIEQRFMLWLVEYIIIYCGERNIKLYECPFDYEGKCGYQDCDDYVDATKIRVAINETIGKFRPDVRFYSQNKSVIFEVDGYAYHNTKDQLTAEKKRERFLKLDGHTVYRFTGTEIHKDANSVAKEAMEILKKEFDLR